MPSGGGPGIPAAPGGLPPFRPGFCFPRRRPPMSSPPCWAGSDSRQPPGSALMPFDELHRCVASIALRAAGQKYEVALAGGNALMVHQVVSRHTEDVDLFVRRLRNVAPAAAEIQAALLAAGYATERLDVAGAGGLGDLWPEAGEELAEWEVTAPDGEHTVQVQVAYFETLADPVTVPDLGPVLALDDLAGWKTVALANRMAARDYVDIAQLLKQYTVDQLVALAVERDPGLQEADFADA